jgi:hypothetical protein
MLILGGGGAAVGRDHLEPAEAHRLVLEVEKVVGHGRVDSDPGTIAGNDRGRREQPAAVRLGGLRQEPCRGKGDQEGQRGCLRGETTERTRRQIMGGKHR